MIQIKNFTSKYHISILVAIITFSFIIKLIYVFYFSEYSQYLYSDMGGYWNRALASYAGDNTSIGQWSIWPPFPHMTLAWFFKVLYVLGLENHKLEATMFMNVLLSTMTVIFVYLIARKLDDSKNYALIVVVIYAFF
ncbi:MAG: hypothetical protein DRQ78_10705, partial [Epsilonproteobacteria bacterium]